ncbi:MAG: acyl-CoA/acyl-ACP dehydrogenase [Planctomycetes bacterium]|nr:acyl-CoA/acyl-ACP dehydrogenase [Planctomycetota bacterium]
MITSPDSPDLDALCARLAEMAVELDRQPRWPAQQLRLCGEYGVFEWFIEPRWGGQDWNEEQLARGYHALAAACITTTFIITQRTGACKRIAGCENEALKPRLLPKLASGETFATVGISHLTTSRQHLGKPVLAAQTIPGGFRLNGMSPWVTGGAAADTIVLAATLVTGLSEAGYSSVTDEQLLLAVPTDLPGISVAEPLPLIGVEASSTGPVHLRDVEVSDEWLIAGPMRHVMASGVGAGTGSYETSTLAIGLAKAAIDFMADEATRRADLEQPMTALLSEHDQLFEELLAAVAAGDSPAHRQASGHRPKGGPSPPSKESLRQRANSLALRATQASLAAAKGSGYVVGHPAGRWCREALFFLVWSCPQPVAAANMCELAGILD